MFEGVNPSVIGIIGGIIGIIGGIIIGRDTAKRQHDLELDRIYLAPFRKWCAELYDELYEVNRRYLTHKAQARGYSQISDIQVIDDWRALHDILAYGMGWLAKIRREEGQWVDQFEELLESIDEFWHGLETHHQFVLQNRNDIISLGLVKQHEVADALQTKGISLLKTHQECINKLLNDYLPKKIPARKPLGRLRQWICGG